jgi:hypothetical protein
MRYEEIKQFTDKQFQNLTDTKRQVFEKMRAAFPSIHVLNEQMIGCLKRFCILSKKNIEIGEESLNYNLI